MHFTKALISLIGLSGLAAATAYDADDNVALAQRDIADVYDDFLVARDEYIEKRELYLRAKTAAKPAPKKPAPKKASTPAKGGTKSSGGGQMLPPGICREPLTGLGWYCCRRGGAQEQCGPMCSNPNGICACQY